MNIPIVVTVFSLFVAVVALVMARNLSQSREFNSCEITVSIRDIDTDTTNTFSYGATSNYTGTRANWIAKFMRDAIANMVTLYPEVDVHRLVVQIPSARFYNTKS